MSPWWEGRRRKTCGGSTLPQHRLAGMTRVGRAMVLELGMKGAVSAGAETKGQLDVKGHTESSPN